MIVRYTDHAANERTFLAWVRTALAVVAFGSILARSHTGVPRSPSLPDLTVDAGVGCVGIGIALVVAAHWRFRQTRNAIGHGDIRGPQGCAMESALAVALAVAGVAVLMVLAGADAA